MLTNREAKMMLTNREAKIDIGQDFLFPCFWIETPSTLFNNIELS